MSHITWQLFVEEGGWVLLCILGILVIPMIIVGAGTHRRNSRDRR